VVTAASVRNALRVLLAIGGSTNALVLLTAMAGRLGLAIDPDELNELSETTPVLVELKPTGSHFMEDLHASGGLPAVLHELRDLLDLSVLTVTGETLVERLGGGPVWVDRDVVRPQHEPSRKKGGLVWLRG
jgi:dihydroxyacid dehydratase/phosphogluconate dehydratase